MSSMPGAPVSSSRRPARRYDGRVDPRAAPFVVASPKAGQSFDIVVVGSGASGGWAAKRLTEAGLRVAVLEAGRSLTDADYREHVPAFDLRYRGMSKKPLAPARSAS